MSALGICASWTYVCLLYLSLQWTFGLVVFSVKGRRLDDSHLPLYLTLQNKSKKVHENAL